MKSIYFSRILFSGAFVFIGAGLMTPAFATVQNVVVGRYITVEAKPLPQQKNIFSQIVQIRFPHSIKTIGSAIRYLLAGSGYTLVVNHQLSFATQAILSKPLPAIHRNMNLISLQEALLLLVGDPFILLMDPVHRLVSFQLSKAYYPIYFE